MKIDNYKLPKSSFLSLDKDLSLIIDKIMENERLQKLLYYTTKDALQQPKLTDDQKIELFGKNIKIVPKLYVDGTVLNYIIISFDNFIPSGNPEFRDNVIEFDIICHFDQWQLGDLALRPYKIAAEIDSMFNNQKMTGIGELQFMSGTQIILNDEFAGFCLQYTAVHGGEDQYKALNPVEEKDIIENFNRMFNQ